ncbi:MAG: hypothetical protein WAO52_09850 [Prolixibacteraceae bacterium]
MNLFKNLRIVLLVIVVLLALVFIRNSNKNLFKEEVKSGLEMAKNGNNLVSPEQLKKLGKPYLIINLDPENIPDTIPVNKIIAIQTENLLDKSTRKILEEVEGDLILYSSDDSKSAKAWMILNQLGFKNVYILSPNPNPEVLNYKFEPDTSAGIETDSI